MKLTSSRSSFPSSPPMHFSPDCHLLSASWTPTEMTLAKGSKDVFIIRAPGLCSAFILPDLCNNPVLENVSWRNIKGDYFFPSKVQNVLISICLLLMAVMGGFYGCKERPRSEELLFVWFLTDFIYFLEMLGPTIFPSLCWWFPFPWLIS